MQKKPTRLNVVVACPGDGPETPYNVISVEIAKPATYGQLGLHPDEREALLRGAFEGMKAALPEGWHATGTVFFTEGVSVV